MSRLVQNGGWLHEVVSLNNEKRESYSTKHWEPIRFQWFLNFRDKFMRRLALFEVKSASTMRVHFYFVANRKCVEHMIRCTALFISGICTIAFSFKVFCFKFVTPLKLAYVFFKPYRNILKYIAICNAFRYPINFSIIRQTFRIEVFLTVLSNCKKILL